MYLNTQPPPPFAHQQEDHERTRDLNGYARFWEQGTGKTRPTIDDMAYQIARGNVDASLVLAPNGVHSNWVTKEWPVHMPVELRDQVSFFEYRSDKADTKWHQKAVQDVLYGRKLPFIAMSYDSLMTDRGLKVAQHMLKRRKCFFTADEAHRCKDPSAKRTKRVLAAAKWAPIRRVLTGTPVLESPFNAYTLMKIVDEAYWFPYRLTTYTTFKAMFGIFGPAFNVRDPLSNLVGFQHLDLLQDALASHSSRLLKEDVLDLPPKLYSTREHELSPEQSRVYEALKSDLIADIEGGEVTTQIILTQLLRLQQITCGHVDLDSGVKHVFEPNPRLKLMAEILKDTPHRAIAFCRFTDDVENVMGLCLKLGIRAGRYDGSTSPTERNEVVRRFQDLDRAHHQALDIIVANTAALSEGRTLTEAKTVIYYSNGWSAIQRQQSEDRAHRIGQDGVPLPGLDGGHGVLYIDIICPGTPDEKIVEAYRKKQTFSDRVMGDNPKDWL